MDKLKKRISELERRVDEIEDFLTFELASVLFQGGKHD